jgi:hypothetical protein
MANEGEIPSVKDLASSGKNNPLFNPPVFSCCARQKFLSFANVTCSGKMVSCTAHAASSLEAFRNCTRAIHWEVRSVLGLYYNTICLFYSISAVELPPPAPKGPVFPNLFLFAILAHCPLFI